MESCFLEPNKFFKLASVYKLLFEKIKVALFLFAFNGDQILEGNPAAAKMSGYSMQALQGMPPSELFAEEDREKLQEIFAPEKAQEDTHRTIQLHLKKKDGSLLPVEMKAIPLELEGMRFHACQLCEVTKEGNQDSEGQEGELLRKIIIERAAEGLCVCHQVPEFPFVRFTVWNPRMVDLTGYTMEEINRLGWYQTMYPDPELQKRAIERMAAMREGEDLIGEEWEITRKDGQRRVFSISTSIFKIHDAEAHVMALMHDLTDKKREEEQRKLFEKKLQESQKLESLGLLAGGIAHDFNNLLVGILGNTEMMLTELDEDAVVYPFLTDAHKAAKLLSQLTNQLLAYAGKGKFFIKSIHLSEIIEEMVPLFEAGIPKHVVLKLELAKALPVIEADLGQIHQVLMNLITNATEAHGCQSGTVTMKTSAVEINSSNPEKDYFSKEIPQGDYVVLEVVDTGRGIDQPSWEKIFEPFFTTKPQGRGLGLAAVLGILKGHQGRIQVTSAPGQGSSFKIFLPCSNKGPRMQSKLSVGGKSGMHTNQTILLVDDEEIVRRVVEAMLKKAGYEVLTAVNGVEALSIIKERAKDIEAVLLDLTMPQMDGLETNSEIQRICDELPVILCSGYNKNEALSQFANHGVAEFIQKPFRYRTLIDTLSRVFEKKDDKV